MNLFNQAGLKAGAERYGAVNSTDFDRGVNFGRDAHASGLMRSPVLDPDFMATKPSQEMMKGWIAGWDQENLKNASSSARENAELQNGSGYCKTCKKALTYAELKPHWDQYGESHVVVIKNASPSELDNAERSMGEYTKCEACGHQKMLHLGADHACYTCDCGAFVDSRETVGTGYENADSSARENGEGYRKGKAPDYVPYGADTVWTCNICDSWSPTEETMKLHMQHDHGIANADSSTLGYESPTSTTTARSKKKIGQKFYTVGNMACPICREEEGNALVAHLKKDHDMDDQDATVVAKDIETRTNADVYVPPFRTLAEKVALGQREYGAVNASAEDWKREAHALASRLKDQDEETVERAIEGFVNRLDKAFISRQELSQEEYDEVQKIIKGIS